MADLTPQNIREYFLARENYTVSNFELVKHFKSHLTDPATKAESRKKFKTYVNMLSTIKSDGNEKFLVLRKKYHNECPTDFAIENNHVPKVAGNKVDNSPKPPPYKFPPMTAPNENFKLCVDEFKHALNVVETGTNQSNTEINNSSEVLDTILDTSTNLETSASSPVIVEASKDAEQCNVISVREATKKFNRIASQEDARPIGSPSSAKLLSEKNHPLDDTTTANMNNMICSHHKSKEWIVSASKSNYQELAKLAQEYPELVRLQDATTTALHWAAKNGNEDVIKLTAGTHRMNVNIRTNGGYTPLHIAVQFGKENIFELLRNVYKADYDVLDWSGKTPLDYRKTNTSISSHTHNKIKSRKKQTDKDLKFLRIGSLNVRVKKTTASFSNFLGVGNTSNQLDDNIRWGSADNVSQESDTLMPPPASTGKKRPRRSNMSAPANYKTQSTPTTPNQQRSSVLSDNKGGESDDSACGFDSNWK